MMTHRVIVILAILVAAMLLGAWLGSRSPYAAAQAVTPAPYPVAPIIPGAGTQVQIWMAGPFCVDTWWDGRQCAEHKGDEHKVGAGWKLDLPGPAWIAPQGRRADGAWLLWTVAKDNEQVPGASFVAVIGPSLVAFPDLVTASPSPTATVTPPPGATATPSPTVASGATPTPSPQGGTPTPTRTATPSTTGTPRILYGNMCSPNPTPEYPHQMVIVGIKGAVAPDFVWWCIPPNATPDLVIAVPLATYEAAYDNGPRQLLRDLGR